jgi:hypothetical protein
MTQFKNWQIGFFLVISLTFFSTSLILAQTQTTLTPSKDNTLYFHAQGALSNAKGQHFFVGVTATGVVRRGVMAFDIAGAIPAGAIIQNATLTLNLSNSNTGPQPITLHKVLADWGEGSSNATGAEGGGAPATTNDATWVHRFFSTIFWSNPGGDFTATPSGSQIVGDLGFYTWGPSAQMTADVQSWLDTPSQNFGWLLMGNEEAAQTAKRFDTREHPIAANRPMLAITFLPTSVEDDDAGFPLQFTLAQNYPNPFNANTIIEYTLPAGNAIVVQLMILNVRGQTVRTLVKELQPTGSYRMQWDGKNERGEAVPSGVYVYRLSADHFVKTRKMLLLR